MLSEQIIVWIIFNVVVLGLLVADLTLFQRRPREMKMHEALTWSAFWILLAGGFNVLVYYMYQGQWWGFGQELSGKDLSEALTGRDAALQFLTGYLIELSLSVDNLFVFLAIFGYFHVRGHHQHRVLFWGILGAVVLRAIMILGGVALIEKVHWVIYILGLFLIFTGIKLARHDASEQVDPEHNLVLRMARRLLPVARGDESGRFFTRQNGKLMVTPLFLVLLVVESTDLVFAADSIPAILAITRDPFIAYTSNIFAVLGLRAMYFALAGLIGLFVYLRYGLAAVLIFVGVKMILPAFDEDLHIPIEWSLGVVGSLLGLSVIASLLFAKKVDIVPPTVDDEK